MDEVCVNLTDIYKKKIEIKKKIWANKFFLGQPEEDPWSSKGQLRKKIKFRTLNIDHDLMVFRNLFRKGGPGEIINPYHF